MYVHPDQLAHLLRDAEIMELVNKAQLKLVLIDGFPEIFTFCRRAQQPGVSINSSRADEDKVGPVRCGCCTALLWIKSLKLVRCFSAAGGARLLRGRKPSVVQTGNSLVLGCCAVVDVPAAACWSLRSVIFPLSLTSVCTQGTLRFSL